MNAEQIAAEENLSIEDFVARGNARERGEDVPVLEPQAPTDTDTDTATETPITEPEQAATESAPTEPQKPESDQAAKPKTDGRTREGRKSKIQAEIDAAVEQRRIAKEEADRETARLAQVRADAAAEVARLEQARRAAQPAADQPLEDDELVKFAMLPDAPQRARYRTDEAFASALILFAAEKRIEQRVVAAQQQAAEQQRQDGFQQRLAAHRKDNPKFDEEVLAGGKQFLTRPMWDFVIDDESGPAVLHYLAKHPTDLQRIATLPTNAIIREMAKLGVRLAAAPSTTGPAPTVVSSSAPAPTKPVGSTHSVSATDEIADSDDESVEAHIRRLNKRDGKAVSYARR